MRRGRIQVNREHCLGQIGGRQAADSLHRFLLKFTYMIMYGKLGRGVGDWG